MEVEKYIPRRMNLDISPEAIDRDEARKFLPGDLLDALNVRYYPSGRVKHVQGNVLRDYQLSSGDNVVIGCFNYEKYNTFVYHIYNSLGNHQIVEFDPDKGTFTLILSGSSLNYSLNNYIDQGKIIDDLHVWNDRRNPIRCVNLVRAKAGGYTAPYGYKITLAARPPMAPPTFNVVTDASIPLNYVTRDTWQFAYQYTYVDDRKSTFSMLSKLAYIRLENKIIDNTNNAIDVTVTIPAELLQVMKQVDVAYRAGNFGAYNIFATIKKPTQTTYTVRFTNAGRSIPVSAVDESRLYDAIPPVSEALEIVNNRVFTVINNVGFDVDESLFDLSLVVGSETYVEGKRYFKEGGNYGLGIVFMDDFGRTSFVKDDRYISLPVQDGSPIVGLPKTNRKFVNWTLTGTPPPGMSKYQIVLTTNKFHSTYFQTIAIPHLYTREIIEGEQEGSASGDYYFWQGKQFIKYITSTPDRPNRYSSVYLQIPLNIPFVPDSSCLIRFLQPGLPEQVVPILDVIGEFLVIEPLYTDEKLGSGSRSDQFLPVDWSAFCPVMIEVFKPEEEIDERFFEVSEIFDVVNGAFSVKSGKLYGDTYLFKHPGYIFTPVILTNYNETTNEIPPVREAQSVYHPFIESPSGIVSKTVMDVPSSIYSVRRKSRSSNVSPELAGGQGGVFFTASEERKSVYAVDYNKAASDYGRVHTIYSDEQKKNLSTVVGYSEAYVQNTFVNGLNIFLVDNQYALDIDRGPIKGFKKSGNVLLALHERNTSALYIGEGLIKAGENFILAKTDDVVGDDRKLAGSYGTINPESLHVANDNAFWWDLHRGAVVRYSNAGQFPISSFGMWDYFIKKSRELLPYRDKSKVVTAFDYLNDELIITFKDVLNDSGGVIIPGETWAFNVKQGVWTTRYSFVAENFGSSRTDLISFKDGALWHHHKNELYNNFYGVQYDSKWVFVCNPWPGRNKRYLNIHIKGTLANDLDSETKAVILRTPEGQESFIPAYEFELNEGKHVAAILKDINTPVINGALALRSGEDLISNYLEVEIINDRTDEGICGHVNVVFKKEEYSI